MKIVLILLTTVLSLSILSNDSAGEMIDGLRDGIWIDYSADGKVKRIGMYKAGKPSGFWEWYKQDNLLIADGNYLLGEKEGIWNLYFKNKEKRLQLTYKKGDLNGIQKTFDYIKKRGAKPFDYNIDIEINNALTPTTWTKKEI